VTSLPRRRFVTGPDTLSAGPGRLYRARAPRVNGRIRNSPAPCAGSACWGDRTRVFLHKNARFHTHNGLRRAFPLDKPPESYNDSGDVMVGWPIPKVAARLGRTVQEEKHTNLQLGRGAR